MEMQHSSRAFLFIWSIWSILCTLVYTSTETTAVHRPTVNALIVPLNSTVQLKCESSGSVNITWTGPAGEPLLFPASISTKHSSPLRYRLNESGSLTVFNVTRYDAGYYWCAREGSIVDASVWHLMIDPSFRFHLEMESITYGWYAGLGALIVGVTVGVMKIIVKICCPQCHARASAAARVQQMRQLIVGLETYRHDQSTRLQEHYNSQVDKVKESCALQMEGLRDHYTTKITRFRNFKLPFGNYRDQYWQQVSKVRDYSSVQMERLQENYAKNLGKLRTYSVVQLERFRLQYQLQHKHMAKILEAMNFNIESCRAGPGDMTPHDADTTLGLNVDLSLAQLHISSGLNDYESDSITIGPNENAMVVQVDYIQENGQPGLPPWSETDISSTEYVTPPTGGTPSISERQMPDADLLTRKLLQVEAINDSVLDDFADGDSPV